MNLRNNTKNSGFYSNMESTEKVSGQRAQLLNNIKFEIVKRLNGKKVVGRFRLDITTAQLNFLKEYSITKRFQVLDDLVTNHLDITTYSRNGRSRLFPSEIKLKIGNSKKFGLTDGQSQVDTIERGPELIVDFHVNRELANPNDPRILSLIEKYR